MFLFTGSLPRICWIYLNKIVILYKSYNLNPLNVSLPKLRYLSSAGHDMTTETRVLRNAFPTSLLLVENWLTTVKTPTPWTLDNK
jgi:hypothetical protein